MSLLGKIEAFDQENDKWSDYWDTVEQYFIANGIEDNKKRTATFLTLIGKETYSLLNSLTAPDKPASKKVDELNALLSEHFEPAPLVIAERYKFYCRSQKEDESMATYIADLRRLSIHCDFKEFLSEALRDKFVCGLKNASIRKRLLTERKLNLSKAIELAKNLENASIESEQMEQTENRPTYAIKQDERKKRCYRCNSEQHLANKCHHKESICNTCSLKGHIARACR